jgi:hypothetical protein
MLHPAQQLRGWLSWNEATPVMVRSVGDHVNWFLVVFLAALALLLAMVSSTGYGGTEAADSQAAVRAELAPTVENVLEALGSADCHGALETQPLMGAP